MFTLRSVRGIFPPKFTRPSFPKLKNSIAWIILRASLKTQKGWFLEMPNGILVFGKQMLPIVLPRNGYEFESPLYGEHICAGCLFRIAGSFVRIFTGNHDVSHETDEQFGSGTDGIEGTLQGTADQLAREENH